MKFLRETLLAFCVAFLAAASPAVAAEASEQDLKKSREAIAELGSSLKKELQAAMAGGGPRAAVSVCHSRAPQIAQEISAASGLEIRRVSQRTRNPNNRADATEIDVLLSFEKLKAAGHTTSDLTWSKVEGTEFRYMQAIGVEPLCLQCHGTGIEEGLSESLRALYPDDLATGYKEGDLRGAFVVRGKVSNP